MSSPNEVPLGIRVTESGTTDALQKLRQLHDELNRGTITTKEYRREAKEQNTLLNSNTKLWNESKASIYAANPTLLEFSRTMAGFGQITAAATSGMTAINTAMLLLAGGSDSINQVKIKIAELTNQLDNLENAGMGNTVQAQNLRNTISQLHTELGNLNNQFAVQQIEAIISFAAALGQVAVGAVAAGTTLKTLSTFMGGSAFLSSNIASGLLSALGPIAIVIAGIEGIYQVLKLLDPAFAEAGSALEKSIMDNWHVSAIEAALLAPFVAFAGGIVDMTNIVHANFVNLYNGILTDFINPLINTWDATIGKITGSIAQIPTQFYHTPSRDDILKGFGLGGSTTGSSTSNTDSINQMLVGSPFKTSTSTLNDIKQTSLYSQVLSQGQNQTNQILTGIYQSSQSTNQLAQEQLQANQEQKAAQVTIQTAIQQGIANQTQRIEDLKKQFQDAQNKLQSVSSSHQSQIDSSPNLTSSDFSDIMAAMGNVQSIQSQMNDAKQTLAQLQSKGQILDNATSGLAPILSNLGLSADTGIGSIISGALGDYAGPGGAGINEAQLAEFVRTHDYGVFTKAANDDNGVAHTPTKQEQINAWMRATGGSEEDAQYALGYTKGKSSGSSNYRRGGAFGGLPGQYGNPLAAASGFAGMVTGPTHFLAGESGPEFVHISPSGKSSGNTNITVNVYPQGSVIALNELDNVIQNSLKQSLKRAGFT